MSETLTVLVKEVTSKQGNTNGKAWTRYALVDDSGTLVGSSFESLDAAPGSKVEVTREKKGDFWNITGVKPAAQDAEVTPQAPQVRAKTDPDDERGINARRALQDAVATYSESQDEDVLVTADSYFEWLMSKSNGADSEKASESATDTSASEGQIKEIAELLAVLEKAAPASPDPTWTWTNEAQKYCDANFEKNSLVALTKAEGNQLREYLEERIAAIQAEAGIPF